MIVGFDDLDAVGAVALGYGGADVNARDAEGTSARSERRVFKDVPWIARQESSQIILSGRPLV